MFQLYKLLYYIICLQDTRNDVIAAFEAGISKPKMIQNRLSNKEVQALSIYQIKNILKTIKENYHYGPLSALELNKTHKYRKLRM